MDDDLKLLEAELKALVPATPPARLERRIATELGSSGRGACSLEQGYGRAALPWWRLAVLPLAAAAGFAAMLALGDRATVTPEPDVATSAAEPSPAEPAADELKPIHVENVLYEKTEEEVITATGAAARRERLRFVDTITWQNPRTNASLTWSVPREEVRIVPINYQ